MTKSLERLRRLAKRKGINGTIKFAPNHHLGDVFRYTVDWGANQMSLGKSAQAARFALNHMAGGKDG